MNIYDGNGFAQVGMYDIAVITLFSCSGKHNYERATRTPFVS